MKSILVSMILISLISTFLPGQNFVGLNESEIKKFMSEKQGNMVYQNLTNNSTFKYLKYADRDESQTWLFFLNDQAVCKSVRLICDKSLKEEKLRECNSLYKKSGDNRWLETRNGRSYLVEFKEEEYSFNITIKPNE